MATKIRRIRTVVGIAIGAVKAIFRTGRVWGTTRTRVATARRPEPTVSSGTALAAGAAGGAAGAYFLMRRRGSKEEADEGVDSAPAKTAATNGAVATNGAGGSVPEKESAAAA